MDHPVHLIYHSNELCNGELVLNSWKITKLDLPWYPYK